jgi:oligopeptide transport system permease protein
VVAQAAADESGFGGGMRRSLWAEARNRILRNRGAVTALVVLAVMVLCCAVGPHLTGHPYDAAYQDYVRTPPSLQAYPNPEQVRRAVERLGARMRARAETAAITADSVRVTVVGNAPIDERLLAFFERSNLFHRATVVERADGGRRLLLDVPIEYNRFLFGTDANGRDLLTRTLIAGRVSLSIGILATVVAILIGVLYGAVAGYVGGRVDGLMMRVVDVLYGLPFMFFVIMLVVFFGRNFVLIFIAVGAVEWLDMARIVRGQTLSIKRQEFVQAAEALGVSTAGIIRRHVIPNTLGPVVVYTTVLVPRVILLESFLSFLGLGVQEPMTSWGVLIAEGAKSIQDGAYLLVLPSIFLVLTLLSLNFIGDGLRDALDPRDR